MGGPGLLAEEVATLDVLSGGRVELGFGAGWSPAEFAALGVPFPGPGDRLARLVDVVSFLRAAWPIAVGGGGRAVLTLAGRLADIVSIATDNARRTAATGLGDVPEWEGLGRQVGWVAEGAAGRAVPPVRNLRLLAVVGGSDPRKAAGELSSAEGGAVEALVSSPFVLLGRPADMVEHLLRLRQELGVTYLTVSARHADALRPALDELGLAR